MVTRVQPSRELGIAVTWSLKISKLNLCSYITQKLVS